MASYDGNFTLDPTIINTKEELEDRLKKVVWEWQIDGDEVQSKANLDLLRSAEVCYQALRVQYCGIGQSTPISPNYDKNRARLRVETFQRFSPNLIYNIGAKSAICLNKECLEVVWRDSSRKELAFLYLNPNSSPGKAWAKKTIESFKIALERPAKGCVVKQDNPCLIYKAEYVDPSLVYLDRFMNGPRTPERESLRLMYVNYLQAQIEKRDGIKNLLWPDMVNKMGHGKEVHQLTIIGVKPTLVRTK